MITSEPHKIQLKGFPLPPSVNKLYRTVVLGRFARRVKATPYREYEVECKTYFAKHIEGVIPSQEVVKVWFKMNNTAVKVDLVLYFKKGRVITKMGKIKRLDVDNHVKGLLDNLCPTLGFDDSAVFSLSIIKIPSDRDGVDVNISRIEW